jgi:hypothetical protein
MGWTEQALPQARRERPGPPAAARARRAAAFARVLETLDVRRNNGVRMVGEDYDSASAQSGSWASGAFLECTRNQHRQAAPCRLDKKRRRLFGRTVTRAIHRSTHSTNAGGISFRTIMTRRIRSSRNSAAMPSRAAAIVGYRAQASAIPVADPRLIVGISLNMA